MPRATTISVRIIGLVLLKILMGVIPRPGRGYFFLGRFCPGQFLCEIFQPGLDPDGQDQKTISQCHTPPGRGQKILFRVRPRRGLGSKFYSGKAPAGVRVAKNLSGSGPQGINPRPQPILQIACRLS